MQGLIAGHQPVVAAGRVPGWARPSLRYRDTRAFAHQAICAAGRIARRTAPIPAGLRSPVILIKSARLCHWRLLSPGRGVTLEAPELAPEMVHAAAAGNLPRHLGVLIPCVRVFGDEKHVGESSGVDGELF